MRRTIIVLWGAATLAAGAVAAKPREASVGANVIADLTACRRIADTPARLACYDQRVDALSAATVSGGLVVLDREQVHAARRSLFGFNVPKLSFLQEPRDHDDRRPESNESAIDGIIRTVRQTGPHDWTIVLDDGGVWQVNEAPTVDPQGGDKIHIKHAALGSYLANIAGQRAVRIRRVG